MRTSGIAASIITALCGLFLAAPASAQPPYPPVPASLTLSQSIVPQGQPVRVTGRNFLRFERVTITVISGLPVIAAANGLAGAVGREPDQGLGDVAGTAEQTEGGRHRRGCKRKVVRADANGSFTTRIRVKQRGNAHIIAIGERSGTRAFAVLTVLRDHRHHGGKLSSQATAPTGAATAPAGANRQAPTLELEKATVRQSRGNWMKLAVGTVGTVGGAGSIVVSAVLKW